MNAILAHFESNWQSARCKGARKITTEVSAIATVVSMERSMIKLIVMMDKKSKETITETGAGQGKRWSTCAPQESLQMPATEIDAENILVK